MRTYGVTVRQGSVMPPIIFNVLLNEIRNKVLGENTTPNMKTLMPPVIVGSFMNYK